MMSSRLGRRGLYGLLLPILAIPSMSWAADTEVVLTLEGNPGCSQLVANDLITEVRDTDPTPGLNAYPADSKLRVPGTSNQCVSYTIDEKLNTILDWSTGKCDASGPDEPLLAVNMVVIKEQGNDGAIVYHYGEKGKASDVLLSGVDETSKATAVTFCAGLSGATLDAPLASVKCEDFENSTNSILAGFYNSCMAVKEGGSEDRAFFFAVRKDEDQKKYFVDSCVCNDANAYQCDNTAPNTSPYSCTRNFCAGLTGSDYTACLEYHRLDQTPIVIEVVPNGSYQCTYPGGTGGTASCDSFFSYWGF